MTHKISLMLLAINVYDVKSAVILVQVFKSTGQMRLLENDKVIQQFQVALGSNSQGHKQREGDQKTPEGRYILDYKKRRFIRSRK
ncbi:L,D-transpeptidase family protein [Aliikangiella maris]|uniref:L,D-transpeptidase family protein n=2 Tax=Aliikangiella maris TaxID=3162458 RepID=A0ABV2BZJ2_9GAMM